MKKFLKSKKGVASLVTLVVVIAGAVGAYAYFTSSGSGSGTGTTGTAADLVISQVGAGYDSLIPSGAYSQDQTYAGAGITDFGNAVTLTGPAQQQLTTVVVAFHNWGAAFGGVPITLTINSGDGTVSDMETPSFTAATAGGPSEKDVTFNFTSQNAFVTPNLTYDIAYNTNTFPAAQSLNVALSDSVYDRSVGTDQNPGHVLVNTSDAFVAGSGISGDFPTCVTWTPNTLSSVDADCGTANPNNPGAYGNTFVDGVGNVKSGADIPAVEINVVGGTAAPLSPGVTGLPVDFAITNPGTGAVRVHQVIENITDNSKSGSGCNSGWYTVAPSTGPPSQAAVTLDTDVPPGTTVFNSSGLTISMPTDNADNQDACEGATVALSFASN